MEITNFLDWRKNREYA